MTDWRIQNIKLRLEYAVKANPLISPDGQEIAFDPYEVAIELPLAPKVYTDPDKVSGDDYVLALQVIDDSYSLFRLKDVFKYDFDENDELARIQGALKITLANIDSETGMTISNTTYFPIKTINDNPVEEIVHDMPGAVWKLLVKREEIDTDPPSVVYRLIHVEPGGAGAEPDIVCKLLNCKMTKSLPHMLKCLFLGCYKS